MISPDEQLRFMRRLYAEDLPVSRHAIATVKNILIQPFGVIVNATGEHPFPESLENVSRRVSAKTGSATDRQGKAVRWIVGHVRRGSGEWLFVSAVTGGEDLPALAAVDLAAKRLRDEHVLR